MSKHPLIKYLDAHLITDGVLREFLVKDQPNKKVIEEEITSSIQRRKDQIIILRKLRKKI